MNLDELRGKIDDIDRELVRLLNERTRVAQEVGKVKGATDQEFYVPGREQRVFDKVVSLSEGPLDHDALRAIYREIMSAALAMEQQLTIAHFGQPGTFTHQAAREKFGASVHYEPCNTIAEVFAAVQNNAAHYGVVPIENSTEGAVNATLDELITTPLKIYAEVFMGVAHHLMSNSDRQEITRVYSHPQVLGQCRQWLAEHLPGIETIPHASTAKAAETAAREKGAAAVASLLAAEIHGLRILNQNIQDQAGNTTRFLVLGRRFGPPTGKDKTSIVFTVRHKVGALYDALSSFKANRLNMTKIESRPSRGKAWEYYFFVDLEGHVDDPAVRGALDELDGHCLMLNVLGSYPMADPGKECTMTANRLAALANPWIEGLMRYEPGRPIEEVARELGFSSADEIHKLASNENALGPSPSAIEAMRGAAPAMHLYPDGGAFYLKQALARRLDLAPENLCFGNGSNELIEFLGHAFLGPGAGIVMSECAFIIYKLVASMFRSETVMVPMVDFRHDLEAMAAAIRPDTRLVFVANPNNPTGTMVEAENLHRFVDSLPDHVVAVLDEAYIEMLPPERQPDTLRYVREGRNVFLLRTFSKTYGLAGLRIGYAIAPPEGIGLLERVRQPFNANAMAQAAALAALQDETFVEHTRGVVEAGLRALEKGFEALGLGYVPSAANFILVKVGDGAGVTQALQRLKIIVRPMAGYGLPEYVRITVGTERQNQDLLRALPEALRETGGPGA